MNMKEMLEQMNEGDNHVSLHSYYSINWFCVCEVKKNGDEMKLQSEGYVYPEDAVGETYYKWRRLTGAMPEYRAGTQIEGPKAGAEGYTITVADDDIPF